MNETAENPAAEPSSPTGDSRTGKSSRARTLQWVFAAIVALAIVALLWPRGEGPTVPGGFLVDADGRPTPLGPRLAPVTLVHFWATWCPPCLGEIPTLHRLADDFDTNHDFRIVFVAVDDTVSQVQSFMGEDRAAAVLYDPEWAIARKFGTTKLPETHLVVDGEVVDTFVGATDWGDESVRSRLRARLETE